MERFDPNSPPPKTSDVVIRKWEYSDPVGVPHPDIVEVVVEIKNEGSAPASGMVAEVTGRWRVGPSKAEKRAVWGLRQVLKRWEVGTIPEGQSATFGIPVDVANQISAAEKKGLWPWTFHALLTVRMPGLQNPVLVQEATFPIRPGD
jgi:hypothetical protein